MTASSLRGGERLRQTDYAKRPPQANKFARAREELFFGRKFLCDKLFVNAPFLERKLLATGARVFYDAAINRIEEVTD